MVAVLLSRDILLVDSSVSHHPLSSVSAVASSSNFQMSSWIIFLTLVNGSPAATCCSKSANIRLPLILARSVRKAVIFARKAGLRSPLRSCANAVPTRAFVCTSAGKYFSPAPATASLEIISIALLMVSISSARNFCRLSKSAVLTSHRAVVSARYFSSSARSSSVTALSPSVVALSFIFLPLVVLFFEISFSAISVLSESCWIMASKACCVFSSSISSSYFFVLNSSPSFSSISTTPPL
mmetsp:Transcript_131520/g.228624  ORF Transcript_131520/g.228624 Transcript_131520/m.228624 type:complete len:240 (-) Transcript_131520:647-1366(-)